MNASTFFASEMSAAGAADIDSMLAPLPLCFGSFGISEYGFKLSTISASSPSIRFSISVQICRSTCIPYIVADQNCVQKDVKLISKTAIAS